MYNKKISLLEAVELTIKVWEHIRDKGYSSKFEVTDPEYIYIYDMKCQCPLCEYSFQKQTKDRSFDIYNWCHNKCPLKNCTEFGEPYGDFLNSESHFINSESQEEHIDNADRLVKQLRRYASRVLKKKVIV